MEREERRIEEKSNLLGRNHLQLRLEEFLGKAIFFPWSMEPMLPLSCCCLPVPFSQAWEERSIAVTQLSFRGFLTQVHWSGQILYEQPVLGFRNAVLQMPQDFFFATYPIPPLSLTICDSKYVETVIKVNKEL